MDVLVYDDDEARIALLKNILIPEDYQVVVMRNGNSLIDFFEDQRPDLIVSNCELPKGGYELVNAILTRVQQPFPYVLFLTDEKNEKYVVDCLGPIPGDFVTLPLQTEALQSGIEVAENSIALRAQMLAVDGATCEESMYDPETNLLSRQAIFDRGLVEISRSHRENHTMGVAMIELANREDIVQQHGEDLFRLAIRFISKTIRANIRLYDVVGRWASGQFLLLIPGLPQEYAENVVRRLYQKVDAIKIRLMDDSILEMRFVVGYTCISSKYENTFADIVEQAEYALTNAQGMQQVPPVKAFSPPV